MGDGMIGMIAWFIGVFVVTLSGLAGGIWIGAWLINGS